MREHEQFCKLRGTDIQVGRTDLGCACLRLFQIRQHELRRIIRILKKELATYDDYVALVITPKDPWEEALEKDAQDMVGEWDGLLRSAISLNADAIVQLDGDKETYIECIVSAATCIRQMAPEGTKWDEPSLLVPGGERPRLRSVVQSLLEADEGHSACFRNEGSVTYHLVSAEASLHALWLAAVEER